MLMTKFAVNKKEYNITKSKRQVFPSRLADKEKLLQNLNTNLNQSKQKYSKSELWKILHKNSEKLLRSYSQAVFNKVFEDKEINDSEVQKWMKLFQTAFIEMEWLFWNMSRRSWWWKTWFDHLLGVLDNILLWPNPTIKECILALLHDSVEDIPWYTIQHIKDVYGEKIANSVNIMTKEPLAYYLRIKHEDNKQAYEYLKDPVINNITRNFRRENYYGAMPTRWSGDTTDEISAEISVKFADRLDSLKTMYMKQPDGSERVDEEYLIKKLWETYKYFLLPELKDKASNFHYTQLENKYLERQNKLNNRENWELHVIVE